MMISDRLNEAKAGLSELMRKRKFKKANESRNEAAELQSSLAKCRGKLEICLNDFNRTIKNQSRNIAEGTRMGADTIIQEQMLWDAAIGYMLVKDAIYALKTLSTQDSISHAYEMLDAAVSQMSGKGSKLPKLSKLTPKGKRNGYGYITSEAALKEKEELLDGFFESLKLSGDIEQCLATMRHPGAVQADRRMAYIKGKSTLSDTGSAVSDSEMDRYSSALAGLPSSEETAGEIDPDALNALMDIHPPTD